VTAQLGFRGQWGGRALDVSADGRLTAAAWGGRVVICQTDEPGQMELDTGGGGRGVVMADVRGLRFLPGATDRAVSLVVADAAGPVAVYRVAEDGTTNRLDLCPAGAPPTRGLDVSPDGRLLALGDEAGSLTVWRLGPGGTVQVPAVARRDAHAGRVAALAFSPDSKSLVTAGADRKVRVWAVAADGPVADAPTEFDVRLPPKSVAFHPDGRHVAVAMSDTAGAAFSDARGGGGVAVVDLVRHLVIDVATGTPGVTQVAITPDGASLVAACEDLSLRFTAATTEQALHAAEAAVGRNLTPAEWDRYVGRRLTRAPR
jgi:WD40 repeat protein